MGHVSNYIVAKAYLADNPQWRAQQDAPGARADEDAEPAWVDVDRLATLEQQRESDDEDEMPPDLAVAHADGAETEMLAFPLLSEEQSRVWLHSRQDLLRARLHRLLRASPAHMTPRQLLATRLGVRAVPGVKRAFIAFLNRCVAAGHVERVRVQLPGASPLYVRATDAGLARLADGDEAAPAADAPRAAWALERETSVELQLLRCIDASHSAGCTLQDLAVLLGASTDVKRMIEQLLARQTTPPYTPLTICAPFEQEGRERRIRYYTFAGFEARCAADGVDLASALGLAPGAPVPRAAAVRPHVLPGEAPFPDTAAYAATLEGLQRREVGFFRDVSGPTPLRKRKAVDPATGQPKRGRPRKTVKTEEDADVAARAEAPGAAAPGASAVEAAHAAEPAVEAARAKGAVEAAPPPEARAGAPHTPHAWSQLQPAPVRADVRRANMSTFQRSSVLLAVVERAGGALDELDVPRLLQDTSGPDLADRTTRAKVVREAVRRGVLRTTKVQRDVGDAHRQRTILYLPSLEPARLHAYVQDVVHGRRARGAPKPADLSGADAGLVAAPPAVLPWATAEPVAPDAGADPAADPATRRAFARLSHVLRAYYGFVHGAAARLRLFHAAALAQPSAPHVDLAYFWTACPLWTYVALVPVRLRTRTAVRAVLADAARTQPVSALPEPVAQRLGVRRVRAHAVRFQSYAEQLVALGAAARDGDGDVRVLDAPRVGDTAYDVRAPGGLDAYWAALRAAHAPGGTAVAPPTAVGFLRAPHAWQDTYALRRPQRAFLRRYAQHEPSDALVARLAHACVAPPDAVAAFLRAPARAAPRARDVLTEKVALRRAQRETEFDAMLAAAQAEHPVAAERRAQVDRLLAQHRRRYLHGREALSPAELQARLRTTLAARAPRRRTPGAPRRRVRTAHAWTPACDALLRDAYVVLAERHARLGGAGAPDANALAPLVADDARAAWATWRAHWKQLLRTPQEQARARVLVRAWAPLAAAARADGVLSDVDVGGAFDVSAHVAHLRAHLDVDACLARAAVARRVVLPRRAAAAAAAAARWAPLAPRTSLALASTAQPMVHRLHAQRSHALSVATYAAARVPPACAPLDGVADAAARMLVGADAGAAARLAAALGGAALDAAIARLVARRAVRVAGEAHGRVHLAYTDEHARALQAPLAPGLVRDARAATAALADAGAATATPAASDGATAAFIAWLDAGVVRASLDLAPLHELRRRTQLNARTLDDVETECCIALERVGRARDAERVAPPAALCDADVALPASLASLAALDTPAGVCVAALDGAQRAAAAAALAQTPAPLVCVGYDVPRIVSRAHLGAWTLRADDGARFVPCAWRDVGGAVRADVWAQRVALVHGWCVSRPGVALAHLAAQLAPAVDRLELVALVGALAGAGALTVRAPCVPWTLAADAEVALEPGAGAWFAVGA